MAFNLNRHAPEFIPGSLCKPPLSRRSVSLETFINTNPTVDIVITIVVDCGNQQQQVTRQKRELHERSYQMSKLEESIIRREKNLHQHALDMAQHYDQAERELHERESALQQRAQELGESEIELAEREEELKKKSEQVELKWNDLSNAIKRFNYERSELRARANDIKAQQKILDQLEQYLFQHCVLDTNGKQHADKLKSQVTGQRSSTAGRTNYPGRA